MPLQAHRKPIEPFFDCYGRGQPQAQRDAQKANKKGFIELTEIYISDRIK